MNQLSTLAGAFLISYVNGHSWLHCSDYDSTITGQDFDEGQCNGYIRYWSSTWGATSFATDRGINYQASGGNWCQDDQGFSSDIESMYDDGYPPATWNIGETVTLVWPAKNHANYECFSNIPDTSMKLYYNPTADPDSEPSGSDTVTDDWTLLYDFQDGCTAGTDGCGFQNCPEFCDDTDGAPCFGEFTITRDDFPTDGYYSIMWYWIFNPGSPYTTCFEVEIVGGNTDEFENDDDDDTNSGSTNNNNDDSDDDDDSDPDYIVTVPICYTGSDYDESTLLDGADNAYSASVVEVSWSVLGSETGGTGSWNVTITTHATDAAEVNSIAYSYADGSSQLCESIASEFGDDDDACYVCDPGAMRTYTLNGSSSSSSSTDDEYGVKLTIGLIVAGLVILGLLLFYVYREKLNPQPKTEVGMSTHVAQTQQTQQIQPMPATDTATR